MDNLIQIGHDTVIGKKLLLASGLMIAGCCIIEDDVQVWGQVGMASGKKSRKRSSAFGKTG